MIKIFFRLFIFSVFFTVVIYIINYYFFGNIKQIENNIAEEKYIEIENQKIQNKNPEIINKNEKNKLKTYFNTQKQKKYIFNFSPFNYKTEIKEFQNNLIKILNNNIFNSKITNLEIDLIKKKLDRRGKMKDKKIKLFGITENKNNEYLSVFTHEFGHYLDLYFLEKKVFLDISTKFYEISWESTKIKKIKQTTKDFVSGYAMTNKYEDFAETFTYYILHNKDFLQKTKESKILKQKYDFFSDYLFKNKEFFATDFEILDHKIKKYYRDITKINFKKEKLFLYLNKGY